MFDEIVVDPRVSKRHPELDAEDVRSAWENAIVYAERFTEVIDTALFVAVGMDARGRMIEMVAVAEGESIRIFHAMTPPSKKTLTELRIG